MLLATLLLLQSLNGLDDYRSAAELVAGPEFGMYASWNPLRPVATAEDSKSEEPETDAQMRRRLATESFR